MAIYPYKAAEAPFSYLEDHLLHEQGLHFRMPYIPSLLSLKVFPHPPGEIPSRFPFSFPLRGGGSAADAQRGCEKVTPPGLVKEESLLYSCFDFEPEFPHNSLICMEERGIFAGGRFEVPAISW